jgi:hypothetical protein
MSSAPPSTYTFWPVKYVYFIAKRYCHDRCISCEAVWPYRKPYRLGKLCRFTYVLDGEIFAVLLHESLLVLLRQSLRRRGLVTSALG